MAIDNNVQDLLRDVAEGIRGVKGGSALINPQNFRSEITALREVFDMKPLPTTSKTFTMKDGTTMNVAVTPHIKVVDANMVSWSLEDWHAKAVENGFDKTLRAAPIGYDIHAGGRHFLWFFRSSIDDVTEYYDVTGTNAVTNGRLRHSQYRHPLIASTYIKTDSNGTTARATIDGNDLVLSTTNSPTTWRMKRNMGGVDAWMADDVVDRFDALFAQSEWFRHRAAIDSGLTTTETDGTIGTVTILNASGSQAAVGEDMYFYVNGVNSNLLAKYNIHAMMNAYNPTQAIVDAIYGYQKDAGINMMDTGVNSSTKRINTEGAKTCEAYAFGGKWMIVTPVLSYAENNKTLDRNTPDAPDVYYHKWLESYYATLCGSAFDERIVCPDWWQAQAYWCNKNYALTQIRNYLISSKGEAWTIPAMLPSDYVWCSERISAIYTWIVYVGGGYMSSTNASNRYIGAGVVAFYES